MPTLFQAVVFALLLPAMAEGRNVADQPLLLDVFVNGENIGKIGEFVLRGNDLLATKNELRELGFRVPADLTDRATGKVIGTPSLISLGALSGVSWHIDTETQSIQLTVPLVRLLNTTMGDDTPAKLARREQPESSFGVTMNYDTAASLSRGVGSASGLFDLRQYSRLGAFSSGFLTYYGGNRMGSEQVVRLDTTFTRADATRMRRLNLGDFVSGSLAWSRPVRLEGVQVRSDFSTRPDLITFPLPTLHGSVSVPSSIQVFTDTGQSLSSQVSSGAFQIPQVPMVTGAGTLILSVTDATGRQVTTQHSFYASPSLLRPGLQSYSIEAGRTRLNWGLHSEDFGSVAGVGTYRRGITPSFTAESTAQIAMNGGMAGAGAVMKLGNFGTMNGAAAASLGPKGPGGQISLNVERKGRYTSMTASYLAATSHFSDIASLNGDGILRSQLTVSGSVSSHRGASVGVLYAAVHRDVPTLSTIIGIAAWPRTETAALTYTQQMHSMSAYVNTYEDLTNHSLGLLAGVVIRLGRRTSVNVSAGYSGTPTQVQVSKPAAEVGEWGFQAFADASAMHHVFGDVERRTEHGFVTAGLDSAGGITTLRTTSSGSISFVDRGVFLANHIQDSFAVVDLSGLAGVRVLDEQRVVGRSDRRGRLLVPDLRAYQANHLAIDTSDVPLDITLTDTSRTVRPRDRSGVIVRFNTADSHSALVTFVDGEGAQVPVGTIARLVPGGEPSPVGYDGSAYLVDLIGINRVKLELPDGSSCFSEFKYAHLPGTIAAIGPLPCR